MENILENEAILTNETEEVVESSIETIRVANLSYLKQQLVKCGESEKSKMKMLNEMVLNFVNEEVATDYNYAEGRLDTIQYLKKRIQKVGSENKNSEVRMLEKLLIDYIIEKF